MFHLSAHPFRLARYGVVATLAAVLLAPASALADPTYRLEASVAADGRWAVSGERLTGGPAQGVIEVFRDGTLIPGATADGDPGDASAFARLDQDRDPLDPLGDDVVLAAGDELRYSISGGPVVASATFAGRPAIAAACSGATSLSADVDAGTAGATGGADAGSGGTPRSGTATLAGTTATVALDGPLTAGSIAWVETTRTLPGDDVLLVIRTERAVTACAAPFTPSTGTGALALLSDSRTDPAPAPAAPAPAPQRTQPPAPDRKAPTVNLELPKLKVKALSRSGFAFGVGCGEPCRAQAGLSLDRKTAERLKIVKKTRRPRGVIALGTGSATVGAGRGVVPVKIAAKTLKRLRRAKRLTLGLSVRVVDAAGNAATATKAITVKR